MSQNEQSQPPQEKKESEQGRCFRWRRNGLCAFLLCRGDM